MDTQNCTNLTLFSDNQILAHIQLASQIISLYAIPFISIIGLAMNLLGMILLKSAKNQKNTAYKYIFFKTLIDVLLLVSGIGYGHRICKRCNNVFTESYLIALYSCYVFGILRRSLSMMPSFILIINNLNRSASFMKTNNVLHNVKSIFVVIISFLIFCFQSIPSWFQITVQATVR